MKIVERIHNLQTGEIIDAERNATPAEVNEYEKAQLEAKQIQAELDAKTQQRAAILERLGLSEEEARLLLG